MSALSRILLAAVLAFFPSLSLAQPAAPSSDGGLHDGCVKCHARLTDTLSVPAEKTDRDIHAQSGVTCSSCHGGDPNVHQAVAAHSGQFVGRPTDVTAMCGRCHKRPAENFLKSPHNLAKAIARRATCVTCHGAHGTSKASLDLIREPLCSSCHKFDQARRIWKALTDAETEFAAVDAQLAALNDGKEYREQLKNARSDLRGLSHALDLFAITRQAANALSTVEEVRAKVGPRLEGEKFGRLIRRGGATLGIILIAFALAWLARRLWRHRPETKRGLLLLGVGGGVVTLAAAAVGLKSYHYIQHDPRFCTSCHIMDEAFHAWGKSAHKDVECHACHAPDLASNLHQLWMYATERPDQVVKHAFVDKSVCEGCHVGGNRSKWNRVAETVGHRLHAGSRKVECIQCHAPSVHRFKPTSQVCGNCHKEATLKTAGGMADMHCVQCHPFLSTQKDRKLKPDRAACLECHGDQKPEPRATKVEGVPDLGGTDMRLAGARAAEEAARRGVKPARHMPFPSGAPMEWTCADCHKPHEKIKITAEDCAGCHGDEIKGAIHKIPTHNDCVDCHKPHSWDAKQKGICEQCHSGMEKHHPGGVCTDCHNNK